MNAITLAVFLLCILLVFFFLLIRSASKEKTLFSSEKRLLFTQINDIKSVNDIMDVKDSLDQFHDYFIGRVDNEQLQIAIDDIKAQLSLKEIAICNWKNVNAKDLTRQLSAS
ncbi:MAG: hypothetical protein PW786_08530 [Arachidicoccus sp.]|nr:hypothetical protein [Arachidicoccus sp.]